MLEGWKLGLGGKQDEESVWINEPGGSGNGFFHTIYCAQDDAIESGWKLLGSPSMDGCGKAKGSQSLLKEGGLFALRLGQRDGDLGTADGDGDAGKASAGAEV